MSDETKQALQSYIAQRTFDIMCFVMKTPKRGVILAMLLLICVFLAGVFCGLIPTILTYSGLTFFELVGIIIGVKISFFILAGISYYFYHMKGT